MAEKYLEPSDPIVTSFADLEVGETVRLPFDALTPSTIDDMTSSHTPGPIEVYALRARTGTAEQLGRVVLWIADGNHRYHEGVREHTYFGVGDGTIEARKVVPLPDNDIRHIFGAADHWEDL